MRGLSAVAVTIKRVVEWVGIGIAFVAAYFAWRANHKSDDANEIARRALSLSESD